MADQKVSDLPSLNGADVDAADLLYIIDSSAGTAGSKKITVGQYQVAPYSAGTANGVMYLNGSNVVTTGSGLVFDGTNFATTGTASATKLIPTGGSATGNGMYLPAANTLGWSTNGTKQMELDAAGNLGLGVTPSAWTGSGAKVFELGSKGNALLGNNSVVDVTYNAYFDSAWKYGITGFASYYAQTGGTHQWFTAPSGTAGNAISFSQVMTLDADGDLGVGVTSPGTRLDLDSTGSRVIDINSTSLSGSGIRFKNSGTISGYVGSAKYTVAGGALADFSIDTSGANNLIFGTNDTERARITSGGDLLVGTTTLSAVGNTIFGSSVAGVIHQNNNAASNGFVFTSYRRSNVEIGSVSQNGTTAVLFNTTSDRRLKDNIVPAPSASDDIDAIQIVSHDWKAAPDEHVKYGVIAQDLHAVAPQAVLQGDDGDEIERTWGVDYSKLVPMLIKEIQSLRARVAALEAQ